MVLALAAALVAFGLFLRLPARAIFAMLGALWVAIMVAHLILPEGSVLTRSLGGDARSWGALGGGLLLIWLYRTGLMRLRRGITERAKADAAPMQGGFSETELDRYARHIVLREVGGPGQNRLKSAKVLIVGAGALGSPALLYLAAAGVGTIGVIDDDTVSNSNLQRQVIHTDARIGMPKVFSAELSIRALNSFVETRPYNRRLTETDAPELFAEYDLILDGTDNFATRYLVNAAAVATHTPLISGAISQWEGQVSLFDPASGTPCYACIFPEEPAPGLAPSCAEAGVMGALPGVVGSIMATEAIKHITGAGQTLAGRMLIHDALWGETRVFGLKRRAGCGVCGGGSG